MTDPILDARLQHAASEYLEHQNDRMRLGRKYGPWLTVAMLLLLLVAFGLIAYFIGS